MIDDDKTLVERLRGDLPDKKVESHWITDYTAVEMQNREAADRIEAQAAEIARLRGLLAGALEALHIEGVCGADCLSCGNIRAALGETE
jgi:hypothetical protein